MQLTFSPMNSFGNRFAEGTKYSFRITRTPYGKNTFTYELWTRERPQDGSARGPWESVSLTFTPLLKECKDYAQQYENGMLFGVKRP